MREMVVHRSEEKTANVVEMLERVMREGFISRTWDMYGDIPARMIKDPTKVQEFDAIFHPMRNLESYVSLPARFKNAC